MKKIIMVNYQFRKALISDLNPIWDLIELAIQRRKEDGSNQWQDGYPNPAVLENDIHKESGFVLTTGESILGYCAVLIDDEPEYSRIQGDWLTNESFVVFHRLAISEKHLGQGLAKMILKHIEDYALQNSVYSIKADTNFDNTAMLKIFEKSAYTYCGEVYFRGSPRKAYEKVIVKDL